MHTVTHRAVTLWKGVPDDLVGKMPLSYAFRAVLYDEFPNETRRTVNNCALQAIRIVKSVRAVKRLGGSK